jgi:putative Mg2+ transporter-C (MgtC) family protein
VNYFNPFSTPFWITIGVAILCGAIIGLERQLHGKSAGVRTSCLICLSTAVFVHLGAGVAETGVDPTRVLGQLVTGVGFLGAGVILAREGVVSGVTTAAVIWVLAAIGAAIGFGHMLGAIALSLVTVGILIGIDLLESGIRQFRRGVHSHDPDKQDKETL